MSIISKVCCPTANLMCWRSGRTISIVMWPGDWASADDVSMVIRKLFAFAQATPIAFNSGGISPPPPEVEAWAAVVGVAGAVVGCGAVVGVAATVGAIVGATVGAVVGAAVGAVVG